MKKITYFIILFFSTYSLSRAQVAQNTNLYTNYTLGVSVGGTMLKGDLPKTSIAPAVKINYDKNFSPFLSVGIEAQLGMISEGKKSTTDTWSSGLYDKSNYGGVSINGKLAAGQFIAGTDNSIIKALTRLYVGTGFGFLSSHASDIQRGTMAGKDNGSSIGIPSNIGIDIPIKKSASGSGNISFNVNYQFTFIMGDNFDAFNYYSKWGGSKDAYSLISAGLKINLGSPKFKN